MILKGAFKPLARTVGVAAWHAADQSNASTVEQQTNSRFVDGRIAFITRPVAEESEVLCWRRLTDLTRAGV